MTLVCLGRGSRGLYLALVEFPEVFPLDLVNGDEDTRDGFGVLGAVLPVALARSWDISTFGLSCCFSMSSLILAMALLLTALRCLAQEHHIPCVIY